MHTLKWYKIAVKLIGIKWYKMQTCTVAFVVELPVPVPIALAFEDFPLLTCKWQCLIKILLCIV